MSDISASLQKKAVTHLRRAKYACCVMADSMKFNLNKDKMRQEIFS